MKEKYEKSWYDYFMLFALIVFLILFILIIIKEGFPTW